MFHFLLNLLNILVQVSHFLQQRTFDPKYRLSTGESRHEETIERKCICSQLSEDLIQGMHY